MAETEEQADTMSEYAEDDSYSKRKRVIKKWTTEEDLYMMKLVEEHGTRHWGLIGSKLNGRTGKQCRERWHNQLDPNINKTLWTAEEEKNLLEAHTQIGNKWAEIAKRIPGRTDNAIKNHWNSAKRRLLRQQLNVAKGISPRSSSKNKVVGHISPNSILNFEMGVQAEMLLEMKEEKENSPRNSTKEEASSTTPKAKKQKRSHPGGSEEKKDTTEEETKESTTEPPPEEVALGAEEKKAKQTKQTRSTTPRRSKKLSPPTPTVTTTTTTNKEGSSKTTDEPEVHNDEDTLAASLLMTLGVNHSVDQATSTTSTFSLTDLTRLKTLSPKASNNTAVPASSDTTSKAISVTGNISNDSNGDNTTTVEMSKKDETEQETTTIIHSKSNNIFLSSSDDNVTTTTTTTTTAVTTTSPAIISTSEHPLQPSDPSNSSNSSSSSMISPWRNKRKLAHLIVDTSVANIDGVSAKSSSSSPSPSSSSSSTTFSSPRSCLEDNNKMVVADVTETIINIITEKLESTANEQPPPSSSVVVIEPTSSTTSSLHPNTPTSEIKRVRSLNALIELASKYSNGNNNNNSNSTNTTVTLTTTATTTYNEEDYQSVTDIVNRENINLTQSPKRITGTTTTSTTKEMTTEESMFQEVQEVLQTPLSDYSTMISFQTEAVSPAIIRDQEALSALSTLCQGTSKKRKS